MAVFNSTEAFPTPGLSAFGPNLQKLPELEKISCRFRSDSTLHPLELMGKRILNAQLVHVCNMDDYPFSPESSICTSTVLAVQLGSIAHGIETSLLLQDDDGSAPYFADITSLTVLDVLADPSPAP